MQIFLTLTGRARRTLRFYREHFVDYPTSTTGLVPYLF
jgi:hypothetical protein